MLEELGYRFEILPSHAEEVLSPDLTPEANAEELATCKAVAISRKRPEAVVLGADTLVAVEGSILGKPQDRDDAVRMLETLSGTRHRVISGVCVVEPGGVRIHRDFAVTWLTMDHLAPSMIQEYVSSGASDGKAGAYAYQEGGDRFLTIESGSEDTVVGLPMVLARRFLSLASITP